MTANRLGIDFSQDFFDVVLADAQGQLISPARRFAHDRPGSQQALAYVLDLCQQHPADQLWIGGEATGLLWWHLFQSWAADPGLAACSPTFYLLNPQPIKQFSRATPRRDKSDPLDARLIVRYLGVPDHGLSPWLPDPQHWPLRLLTRHRCRLSQSLGRFKLQALACLYLKASAYASTGAVNDVFGAASRKVLRHYPSLDHLAQVPLEELALQLRGWGKDKFADPRLTAEKLQAAAQRSYPLSPAMAGCVHFLFDSQLKLIEALEAQLKQCDRLLEEQFAQDVDIAHLDAIPGIGLATAAGLVAELRPTERFFQADQFDLKHGHYQPRTLADAQAAVGKLAGLWWPRSQSGKQDAEERHMPKAANPYLRYYLVECANHVREHVAEYGAYYQKKYQEARKHRHRRALVLTARKLARLVFALLHKHDAYQPRRCLPL